MPLRGRAKDAAVLLVMAMTLGACSPSDDEPLSERWVIEKHSPWNPDGRFAKYLSRRDGRGLRRVSGKLFAARYRSDDCVIYTGYDSGLYGVWARSRARLTS